MSEPINERDSAMAEFYDESDDDLADMSFYADNIFKRMFNVGADSSHCSNIMKTPNGNRYWIPDVPDSEKPVEVRVVSEEGREVRVINDDRSNASAEFKVVVNMEDHNMVYSDLDGCKLRKVAQFSWIVLYAHKGTYALNPQPLSSTGENALPKLSSSSSSI
ncbi:hypothetical protein L1987_45149 [Smallanthus sonchifolius]|uniref:Uncharacterized protein n=1 Tax=Smallanthus sonchifolius TaxID=185202 RepID=A0ACB9GRH3_9ASTR|nr:hypothetical protein L1987_45149 [Smallanthus sonchifolius]